MPAACHSNSWPSARSTVRRGAGPSITVSASASDGQNCVVCAVWGRGSVVNRERSPAAPFTIHDLTPTPPPYPAERPAAVVLAAAVLFFGMACGAGRGPTAPTVAVLADPATVLVIGGVSRLTAAQLVAWLNERTPRRIRRLPRDRAGRDAGPDLRRGGRDRGRDRRRRVRAEHRRDRMVQVCRDRARRIQQFRRHRRDRHEPESGRVPRCADRVRAQIQHLRAYADASALSCTVPPLHLPLCRSAVQSRRPQRAGAVVEPDGQRQLGYRADLRDLDPLVTAKRSRTVD